MLRPNGAPHPATTAAAAAAAAAAVAAAPSVPWGNARASGGGAVLAPPLYRVSFTQSPGGSEGGGEDEDEDGGGGGEDDDDDDGDSGGGGAADGALGATGPGGAGPLQRAAGAFAAAVAAGDLQRLGTGSSGSSVGRRRYRRRCVVATARASELGLAVQATGRQPGVPGVRYSLLQVQTHVHLCLGPQD